MAWSAETSCGGPRPEPPTLRGGHRSPACACPFAADQAGGYERVAIGGARLAVKLPQFRVVNTVLSDLKTGLSDTSHAARCCLWEFQHQFNWRINLHSILEPLDVVVSATRPHSPGTGCS